MRIKFFQSDNGFGFTFSAFSTCQKLFLQNGIHHKKSTAYTPQQNERVERKYKHLLDVAKVFYFKKTYS